MDVQLYWISVFSTSSWVKTTASGLSYEQGVNGEKKVNENWDIVNKNGHSTFHTSKPGNFNSLKEVIRIILWHCYLEIDCRVSAKKSVMVINILQMICIGHVLENAGLYQQTLL